MELMELYDVGSKASVFKDIYGKNFNTDVSKNCEMANLWAKQEMSGEEVAKNYFLGGFKSFNRINEILIGVDVAIPKVNSYLDFACGFGRTTRFFLQQLDPSKITVSDISADAVEFQMKHFKVDGFNSAALAKDLKCDKKFDLITVNSLFSHLNIEFWTDWLKALTDLLNPGGHILFSTHGRKAYNKRKDDQKAKMERESNTEGFYYWPKNETLGRLDADYYGTCYVMPDWVRKQVRKNKLGKIVASHNPMLGFMGGQDVYVIKKV